MHQHAYAMCIHTNEATGEQRWHAACAASNCNEDHWFYEAELRVICCAYCGSTTHWPIECPLPARMRFTGFLHELYLGNAIHIGA